MDLLFIKIYVLHIIKIIFYYRHLPSSFSKKRLLNVVSLLQENLFLIQETSVTGMRESWTKAWV